MKITDIHTNPDNPRKILPADFDRLTDSVLQFPKMMAIRPIVVDANGMDLGGNQRNKALHRIIEEMGDKELRQRCLDKAKLVEFWEAIRKSGEFPDEWVCRADNLTEAEKRRFIIADNTDSGQWDWDVLANEWEAVELGAWGLDVPEEWGEGLNTGESENPYDGNIKAPTYEPKNEKPKIEVPEVVLSECTILIMEKFNHLGVEEIREAYRMKASGGLNVPRGKGEMWGGVFNAEQLGSVLTAYCTSRRKALAAYLNVQHEETRAAKKKEIKEQQKAKFEKDFPGLIQDMKDNAKDWRDCKFWLYQSALDRGLFEIKRAEALEIFEDAKQLARMEVENEYAEAVETGGRGVFEMQRLRKAMEDEKGIESRAKTIARQITLYRKLVLTK